MALSEETIKAKPTVSRNGPSVVDNFVKFIEKFVKFISSVRFGVVLLCTLVVLSMIGMLIIQQNVQGFDAYYASLTPAEKTVYGALGIFDIYHSWYFNVLLLILSLNIVLASIDRFPSAWSYVVKPKLTATREWLLSQRENAVITVAADDVEHAKRIVTRAFEKQRLKPVASQASTLSYPVNDQGQKVFTDPIERQSTVIFGQTGKFNRLGAYIVHVALLTLFLGHFVALQTGFDADVRMIPGDATDQIQMIQFDLDRKEKFNVQLPFTMTCTDIQQKLIDPRGSIDVRNTIDWRTQLRVDDSEYGTTIADISMNQPFTYRGFRFFQAQTIPVGSARIINIDALPTDGGEPVRLEIPRLGSSQMSDGTVVEYEEFLPDFVFNQEGKPDTRTGEYNNPVAVLGVTPPGGERIRVFAFAGNVAENVPVGAPKAGFKWKLAEFEKAPFAHVLSIKYDPYSGAFIAWYFGGIGLMAALSYVFFFSHRRYWADIVQTSANMFEVTLGGHANRNHSAFEDRFHRLKEEISKRDSGSTD